MNSPCFHGQGLACLRGGKSIFRDLDITLLAGDMAIILGANGIGKSSLLMLLAGLIPPAAGTLSWEGKAIRDAPTSHSRRLHYISHGNSLKAVFTVETSLIISARLIGLSLTQARRAADRVIAHLNLPAERAVAALSAGWQRRLTLARLHLQQRPLWILDEPLTHLDSRGIAAFEDDLDDHRAAGGTVVIALHDGFSSWAMRYGAIVMEMKSL